ncbi:MAG: hypothetical protein JNK32_14265 [Anaerolineales bacterium]|nr:hypothetical protein [Anaerolineales bacterium]
MQRDRIEKEPMAVQLSTNSPGALLASLISPNKNNPSNKKVGIGLKDLMEKGRLILDGKIAPVSRDRIHAEEFSHAPS